MFMYPRKGLITDPYHQEDIIIQDDRFPPEFAENSQQYQQSYLQPPFQYQPNQFASPPSSAPSSPTFSSPTFSIPYPPQAVDNQSLGAPSMTPASSYNPSLDAQSSASPSSSQQYLSQYPQYYTPMLAQQPIAPGNQAWDSNLQLLSPARISYPHKASPTASSRSVHHQHRRSDSSSKPLPTPVQTPIQNSLLAPAFQNYDPSMNDGSNVEVESAMRRAIMAQQSQHQSSPPQQQQSEYSHSLAPSVSTMSHNSPVTPQNTLDELEDASKSMTNGETQFPDLDQWMDQYLRPDATSEYANGNSGMIGIPKLDRTISDIYQDELYNPAMMATPQGSKSMGQNMIAPRNVIADRLQAANQGHMSARSQSPVSGMKRERSPFRHNSPFAGGMNVSALQSQMATSVPMVQNGMSMSAPGTTADLKTMSPKDAVLDFNDGEDAAMAPLFPPQQGDFNLGDALGLRREPSGSLQASTLATMDAFPSQYAPVQQTVFPFSQQSQAPQQTYMHQQQPKLMPTLSHLDSNGSDMHSSADITPQAQVKSLPNGISRPSNTTSDAGTYTCTYHGCTLRFESPSKLQRHKREAHRQTSPGGHLITRDTTLRNSQAGPHKCERLNPSTGKPCNSVFSRPYDLTRHEDTIHNARKQKVRCHLCTEEKTFSRNDALTRHMRVVHPEVDWPGKQRRRGRD